MIESLAEILWENLFDDEPLQGIICSEATNIDLNVFMFGFDASGKKDFPKQKLQICQ